MHSQAFMSSLHPLVLCLCAYENTAQLQSSYVIVIIVIIVIIIIAIIMFIARYYKKLDSRIPGVIRVADRSRDERQFSLPSSTWDGENFELLVASLLMESTVK